VAAERDACFDPVLWLKPGESGDQIAGQMSACSSLSFEAAKKLLLENNGGVLRPGGLLFVGHRPLGDLRDHWLRERQEHEIACSLLDQPAREMFWDTPRALPRVGALVEDARMWGWQLPNKSESPELSLKDLLVAAMEAPVSVAARDLGKVLALARRLYADALRELGPSAFAVGSVPGAAQRLDEYVKRNPAYAELRIAIQRLPLFLHQTLGTLEVEAGREGAWFRRQFAVPWRGGGRYTRHVATLLQRSVTILGRVGTTLTWIVPMALALPELYSASGPYERGRILFSTSLAIPAGSIATSLLLRAGVRIVAVMLFGPTGGFLVTAMVVGWAGLKVGKLVEDHLKKVYDQMAPRFAPAVSSLAFRGALR
jgi:hypothetical protein